MGVIFRDPRVPPVPGDGSRRAQTTKYGANRPIVASARKLTKTEMNMLADKPRAYHEWQKDAWVGYDRIGEIHYGFNLLANTFSRVRVYGAAITTTDEPPVILSQARENGKVSSDLARLTEEIMSDLVRSDFSSHARNFALNLCVGGECLLLELPAADGSERSEWVIRSTDEVKVERDMVRVIPRAELAGSAGQGNGDRILSVRKGGKWTPEVNIGRIWRQHPRYTDEPDSSMRSLADSIEELLLLSRLIRNASRSRLNAGMLFVPDGLSVIGGTEAVEEPAVDLMGNPTSETAVADGNAFLSDLMDSMVTPIEDESAPSAVVPMVVTGEGDLGNQIKHLTFERNSDEWLASRADRALERILQGIDMPKELVSGLANVKYALTEDAEILTKRGWKKHSEVVVGEDVYTLNHVSGVGEWQPITDVTVHPHDGPVYRMESSTHFSMSTDTHRWPTVKVGKKVVPGTERRWATTGGGFTSTDRVETAAACVNTPSFVTYSDDFVRLVAAYTSDGHINNERAWLSKTYNCRNSNAVAELTNLAEVLDSASKVYKHNTMTPDGVDVVEGVSIRLGAAMSEALWAVAPGREKAVRPEFVATLTAEQLELFLDTMIALGDGNFINGDKALRRYWQTEPSRLEAVAMAGVLAGYTVRWLPSPLLPHDGPVKRAQPCWGITLTKKRTRFSPHAIERHGNAEWVHYTGNVWCPTTPNTTWLARQNGKVFFTGNSNAMVINDNLYKTHVEPLALMFVDALTDIYLRPMLIARGTPPEDADRVCVWYDPSEIVTRPDQSTDADNGFDRYLLSGEAWRKMHGFSELDAPDEKELAIQLLLAKGNLPEDVTSSLLQVAFPKIMATSREQNLQGRETPFPDSASDILNGGDGNTVPAGEAPVDNTETQSDNEGDTQTEVPA